MVSSRESISAPCRAAMPRSPQKATRCAAGIAIGMQQRKDATASSSKARLGGKPEHPPARRRPGRGAARPAGRRRPQQAAIGRITAAASSP